MWSKADFRAIPEIAEKPQMPVCQGAVSYTHLDLGDGGVRQVVRQFVVVVDEDDGYDRARAHELVADIEHLGHVSKKDGREHDGRRVVLRADIVACLLYTSDLCDVSVRDRAALHDGLKLGARHVLMLEQIGCDGVQLGLMLGQDALALGICFSHDHLDLVVDGTGDLLGIGLRLSLIHISSVEHISMESAAGSLPTANTPR